MHFLSVMFRIGESSRDTFNVLSLDSVAWYFACVGATLQKAKSVRQLGPILGSLMRYWSFKSSFSRAAVVEVAAVKEVCQYRENPAIFMKNVVPLPVKLLVHFLKQISYGLLLGGLTSCVHSCRFDTGWLG